MKEILYKIDNESFRVHYDFTQKTIYFHIYNVSIGKCLSTGKEVVIYKSTKTGQYDFNTFDENTCQEELQGSYCWRGVWEGRLYFTNDEYFSEDIPTFQKLLKMIYIECKKIIDPENKFIE